ncbi:Sulfite efflux pump SSU1 [Sparassis crispa]|uniref:Sulfite efflux pump SSU1 n=1 Tax=Sparassis crispa TaxID=139825 RepID=A0A401GGA6_9APHY|nr:Sulfite efflux pump SSU1 [Sparassis crispa]GBE81199.1 Sulfite efflux pump SSU1 [Sparassis crispa]
MQTPLILPYVQWKSWRERIRNFTPAWHAVIMGTGVVSALLHNFPYGSDREPLRVAAASFFLLNLVLFVFVCACTVARYFVFPQTWPLMLAHPSQSLFLGCFPMGVTTLINAGLNLHQDWGFGGNGFLYFLWGCWWLDSAISYLTAFGMLYVMSVRQEHSTTNMAAVWLLPFVTLVVASSTGGLLANALRSHSTTLALLTVGIDFVMVSTGLSFALMIITVYLLRLILHGIPDRSLILSAFIIIGPLGQGGYSLLVNGQSLSELLPLHNFGNFPEAPLAGQILFASCFCGAYVLWSMGVAWILVACSSVFYVVQRGAVPFSLGYWGLVFPNGVFALLSVELGVILNSPFFHAFGTLWSVVAFALWLFIFLRSVPSFIDGSMFLAPCLKNNTIAMISVDEESKVID